MNPVPTVIYVVAINTENTDIYGNVIVEKNVPLQNDKIIKDSSQFACKGNNVSLSATKSTAIGIPSRKLTFSALKKTTSDATNFTANVTEYSTANGTGYSAANGTEYSTANDTGNVTTNVTGNSTSTGT